MNLSKIAVKRPVTTLMLMFIVVILGIISLTRVPLDLFPKMEFPMAIVLTQYPNASPEEVENLVTKPIEQQLATVENMKSITSITSDGSSMVLVEFADKTDMNFASLHMRENVDMIKGYLPSDTQEPMILTLNPTMMPIMQVFVSADMPLDKILALVEDEVTPALERSSGVASVDVYGGMESEVVVKFSQEKLAGYGLSLSQVSQILAAENINLPSGEVNKGDSKLIVRTIGQFESIEDIYNTSLTLPTREVIRLGDIATIEEGYKEQSSIGRMNKNPSIVISVTKQSTANTVETSDALLKAFESLETSHPDLTFTMAFDQSEYIKSSVYNVAESAILGCILAVFVIFFFLRNVAATAVIAISIPTSIIAAFILMYFSGLTINMLSLGGLAIGVGMLVDDSIVVLENIYRVHTDDKLPAVEASITGAKQVTMPVFAATMTKIAVFLPIVFTSGLTATMFKEFSYTISFALLASLIVALTVVPMLCSRLMNTRNLDDEIHFGKRTYKFKILPLFSKGINWLTAKYVHIIEYSLKHRRRIIVSMILIFVLSVASIATVGGELIPSSDESMFTISVETPYGTSLDEADKIVSNIEDYVMNNIPELDFCAATVGGSSMFGSANTSDITVSIVKKNQRERSTGQIVNAVRKDLSNIAGAKITVAESSMTGSLAGGNPISIAVKGNDFDTLRDITDDYVEIISNIEGTSGVQTDVTDGNPEVTVKLNRSSAAYYGITAGQLAQTLRSSLSGTTATTLKTGSDEIDVVLSVNEEYKQSVENMKQILITAPTGQTVTVGSIADFTYDTSPSSITRQDQVRTITITSDLHDRDLQSVSRDIQKALDNYHLPVGYSYSTGGEQNEMTETFSMLILALLLSLVIVYMILASQFESLIQPIIIMVAIPFALTGAFIALFITGTPLSMVSFIGIIMLVGIVVNNSILLIDFINQHKETSNSRDEAIINAGKFRLRPIIMTVLTTSLGLLPLSLGLGEGGEIEAPLGITVIGGLLFSTVITLVLIPVMYSIFDDKRIKHRARKAKRKAERMALLDA